jgi:hypothetical protein
MPKNVAQIMHLFIASEPTWKSAVRMNLCSKYDLWLGAQRQRGLMAVIALSKHEDVEWLDEEFVDNKRPKDCEQCRE